MTEERDDLVKIFDVIINNHDLWQDIKFTKIKGKLSIIGKTDTFEFKYSEEERF